MQSRNLHSAAFAGPAVLLVALLSGCAAPGGTQVAGAAPATPTPEVRCNAKAAEFAVGKVATASVVEQARQRSGALMARTLRPGQVVTMEFSGDRLNLDVDAASIVKRVRCG